MSHGDYIQWLDADDLLDPTRLPCKWPPLSRLEVNGRFFPLVWGKFIYRHHRAQFVPTGLWRDSSPLEWLICKMGDNVYMQTASWLVSRELTEAAGPWDTRLLGDDDGEYFCRVLLASEQRPIRSRSAGILPWPRIGIRQPEPHRPIRPETGCSLALHADAYRLSTFIGG